MQEFAEGGNNNIMYQPLWLERHARSGTAITPLQVGGLRIGRCEGSYSTTGVPPVTVGVSCNGKGEECETVRVRMC